MMKRNILLVTYLFSFHTCSNAFAPTTFNKYDTIHYATENVVDGEISEAVSTVEQNDYETKRSELKKSLFRVIGGNTDSSLSNIEVDPVLASPKTKQPLKIIPKGIVLGDVSSRTQTDINVELKSNDSNSEVYYGKTNTYFNLLEKSSDDISEESEDSSILDGENLIVRSVRPLIPPPLSQILDQDYIPMRDLFTSPFVSYAYERGWRNSFSRAGFPGIDKEFELVRDFFKPTLINAQGTTENNVIVDMSCATGLMTRRLVKCNEYDRVIGCDYSDSMLTEARRRFNSEPSIFSGKTKLDLVRCDVGNIPMQDNSVNALHAGAAMHCWPDVQKGINEIYRVLQPGGRYFATTFLSTYFSNLQLSNGNNVQSKAFQYFESEEELKEYFVTAGFEDSNINIEIVGSACVIMRCTK